MHPAVRPQSLPAQTPPLPGDCQNPQLRLFACWWSETEAEAQAIAAVGGHAPSPNRGTGTAGKINGTIQYFEVAGFSSGKEMELHPPNPAAPHGGSE